MVIESEMTSVGHPLYWLQFSLTFFWMGKGSSGVGVFSLKVVQMIVLIGM